MAVSSGAGRRSKFKSVTTTTGLKYQKVWTHLKIWPSEMINVEGKMLHYWGGESEQKHSGLHGSHLCNSTNFNLFKFVLLIFF